MLMIIIIIIDIVIQCWNNQPRELATDSGFLFQRWACKASRILTSTTKWTSKRLPPGSGRMEKRRTTIRQTQDEPQWIVAQRLLYLQYLDSVKFSEILYIMASLSCASSLESLQHIRPIFILIIFRPRIFESKFRSHCANKFDGALRKSTSFV